MGRYIVVSGLPATGKSTVAREIAGLLGLPLLDKDDFLEALFDGVIVESEQRRRQLSRAADVEFRRRAEQLDSAVLTSWWKHPRSSADSGTPIDWLRSLSGPRIEVYCTCSPVISAVRFIERVRHSGHLDGRWTHAELLAVLTKQGKLGPLGIGKVIEVGTGAGFEIDKVMRDVERAFEDAAGHIHLPKDFAERP